MYTKCVLTFKIKFGVEYIGFVLDGITRETQELIIRNDGESTESVRVILKFRKYLFQSDINLNESD